MPSGLFPLGHVFPRFGPISGLAMAFPKGCNAWAYLQSAPCWRMRSISVLGITRLRVETLMLLSMPAAIIRSRVRPEMPKTSAARFFELTRGISIVVVFNIALSCFVWTRHKMMIWL